MTQTRSNKIIIGIMLLLGAVSVFLVYIGLQTLSGNDLFTSFMYIGAGLGAFVVVGYRLFKLLKVTGPKSDSPKEVFTTVECTQCEKKTERPFMRGDYIYKNSGPCTDCSGQQVITKISTHEETH